MAIFSLVMYTYKYNRIPTYKISLHRQAEKLFEQPIYNTQIYGFAYKREN